MCLLTTYSYLQSVEGGTKTPSAAKQETVDLSKFLYIVNSASCDLSQTSHMPNIITYLNRLRNSRVGPSGQFTKLTTIKNALTFLLSRLPDDGGSKYCGEGEASRNKDWHLTEITTKGVLLNSNEEEGHVYIQ